MAMFDVPYLVNSSNKSLKNLIRVENTADIFYDGLSANQIEVNVDGQSLNAMRSSGNGLAVTVTSNGESATYSFGSGLNLTTKKEPNGLPNILAYFFPKQFSSESSNLGFLLPPGGSNLMETVAQMPGLKQELAELFHNYGLKMVFDSASRQIKAMKENGSDIFLVPFSSLADSLQRLIFYKAAIRSNSGKLICFEEPESHTFPPYISSVVNDIIASDDNSFFITTHSPYILSSLLESAGDDLAVFIVDMDDNATVAKRLTEAELQAAYDNGTDFFYNIEAYLGK
jgi:hypothetical protein